MFFASFFRGFSRGLIGFLLFISGCAIAPEHPTITLPKEPLPDLVQISIVNHHGALAGFALVRDIVLIERISSLVPNKQSAQKGNVITCAEYVFVDTTRDPEELPISVIVKNPDTTISILVPTVIISSLESSATGSALEGVAFAGNARVQIFGSMPENASALVLPPNIYEELTTVCLGAKRT